MSNEEIKNILENQLHWIREDCDGWQDMRANLSWANLSGVNLSAANLTGANLTGANLSGANLTGANLSGANLTGANLYWANLSGANLTGANVYWANLSGANLSWANLACADLTGTNLSGANLYDANLPRAKNAPFIPYACPDFGAFIGFKKANGCIIVLEIQEDAKRLSATSRKCRCDKAKVVAIQNIDGTSSGLVEVTSDYDPTFLYRVGEIVSVKDFDENRWNECSTGIHFFISRKEAVDY